MTTTQDPRDRTASADEPPRTPATIVVGVRRLFASETSDYFLLLGTTIFLVGFGLVMVLSSSAIGEFRSSEGNFFGAFLRQGLFAIIGIPLMLIASRAPARFWRRWAWHGLGLGIVLQLLVLIAGQGDYNKNWLAIGSVTVQPSEFIKLALAVWLGFILFTRPNLLREPRNLLFVVGGFGGLSIGLVLLGNDLGTGLILLALVLGALFFAAVPARYLATAVLGIAALAGLMAIASPSRLGRVMTWMNGCSTEQLSIPECWQPQHGLYALAAGGVFGTGLGNSKAKWSWLPHADNDFIFAIIGEELGLVGALVVLGLFIVLAVAFARIIRGARDPFERVTAGAVMVWVIGQAFVNIAVVLGLLPVLGVPLPLISAGGSALIATLLGIGVVLSFARHKEPTA